MAQNGKAFEYELFKKSAVKRTGFSGLKRNLSFIKTEED